jgi:hypothetical protein
LLPGKPNSSINFVAAILIGEISYLVAWATAIREIDLQTFTAILLIKRYLSRILSTVKDWDKIQDTVVVFSSYFRYKWWAANEGAPQIISKLRTALLKGGESNMMTILAPTTGSMNSINPIHNQFRH